MSHLVDSPATAPAIEVRNLRFPLAEPPKYWLGGRRAVSMFFDHLSIVFPRGERFFMNSVRAYEGQIDDPVLRAQVRGFHAQEAIHGREHTKYNARLSAFGYPVAAIDARAHQRLASTRFLYFARAPLAVTVALEHMTAVFARFLLEKDSFIHAAHPEMAALWRWHGAEETEHAATAFDVFRRTGGSYALRVAVLLLTTVSFSLAVLEHQVRMMAADGIVFSLREWSSLARFLLGKGGLLRSMARPYLRAYRPSFHPHDDVEGRVLLEAWKREFASAQVYRDKLYVRTAAAQ